MVRPLGVLAVVAVMVLAGCSGAFPGTPTTTTASTATTTASTTTTTAPPTTTEGPVHPPDPGTDVLGWERGYWYNESLAVDQTDGLNDTELDAVVARSMGRVEFIRNLEFEQSVPVRVISRATYRNRTSRQFADVTRNASLHQNVKFEALFFMGESTSAIEAQEQSRSSNVMGYYSPANDSIVIVSENDTAPKMDELTLSQELFHALQEHRFNVSRYPGVTEETHNAYSGIVEGDANYVEHLYRQHCQAGWDCVTPPRTAGAGGDGGSQTNVGLLALRLQPYSDGPVFVQERRERFGWRAVNAVYEAPPESTEQTIHTDLYRSDSPRNVTIEDRSNATWAVPDLGNGSIDYAQFGEAGMYVMFWYPSYVETRETNTITDVVVPYRHFFGPGDEAGLDRYNYSYRYSGGWDGDKLLPYVRNDSAETNETGYVWASVWDSPEEASEFREGYRRLLEYHGAEPVAGHPDTYRIDEGPFADAFYVSQDGERVVIVNAPTVAALSGVREGAGAAA
ncbi:MAG: Hvo_1808 family surface protein [Halanaeroarchaeum sp.]